jgi:hypothetical protein
MTPDTANSMTKIPQQMIFCATNDNPTFPCKISQEGCLCIQAKPKRGLTWNEWNQISKMSQTMNKTHKNTNWENIIAILTNYPVFFMKDGDDRANHRQKVCECDCPHSI